MSFRSELHTHRLLSIVKTMSNCNHDKTYYVKIYTMSLKIKAKLRRTRRNV